MMSWWELGEQAIAGHTAPRKYSLESLINRLDGLKLDELYALRTFVSLEADPSKAYSGSVNSDLSHLQAWFPTVRVLDRVEQNQLASALVQANSKRLQHINPTHTGRRPGRSIAISPVSSIKTPVRNDYDQRQWV